jgi:hypothetical protein
MQEPSGSEEKTMRTQAQMLTRKRATRMLSVGLIVVGAITLVKTAMSVEGLPPSAVFDHFELAVLWFVGAGAFVGLSRIWGELAERTAPGKEQS